MTAAVLDDPFSPASFDLPPVPLRDAEKELSRLRGALQSGPEPAQRAAMSNLVIVCRTRDEATPILAEIENVVAAHPARVILIAAGAADAPLEARALAWATQTDRDTRIHHEALILTAGGGNVDHLPYAIRSLLVGDVPMNLWWATPTPPALVGPRLYDVSEHAQQFIYDSVGWPDPARGVAAMGQWIADFEASTCSNRMRRVASDLNWRRLKFWRRLVSQALDPAAAPGALESITEVTVEHGPHGVVQAWVLLSWMASRLGWQVKSGRAKDNTELDWLATAPHGQVRLHVVRRPEGPPAVVNLRVACTLNGTPCGIAMQADGPTRLAAQPDCGGVEPRTTAVQPLNLVELVARQLSDRAPDPVFRESMAVAQVFAQRLTR